MNPRQFSKWLREMVGRPAEHWITETEPMRPAAPETPAAPPTPKRELHELSTEELRATTREDLNRLLAHMDGETRPTSPFWRDQDAPKAHGDQ
jgi:hypothetical protein